MNKMKTCRRVELIIINQQLEKENAELAKRYNTNGSELKQAVNTLKQQLSSMENRFKIACKKIKEWEDWRTNQPKLDGWVVLDILMSELEINDKDWRDDNTRPDSYSYYCQWVSNKEGTQLEWDGNEKFYGYVEWLNWLIDNFFKPKGIKIKRNS